MTRTQCPSSGLAQAVATEPSPLAKGCELSARRCHRRGERPGWALPARLPAAAREPLAFRLPVLLPPAATQVYPHVALK